jgi:hypothetical protein
MEFVNEAALCPSGISPKVLGRILAARYRQARGIGYQRMRLDTLSSMRDCSLPVLGFRPIEPHHNPVTALCLWSWTCEQIEIPNPNPKQIPNRKLQNQTSLKLTFGI